MVLEGAPRTLLLQAERLEALGLDLGAPAGIALALRAIFPDLPTDILTLRELESALLRQLLPDLPSDGLEVAHDPVAQEGVYGT